LSIKVVLQLCVQPERNSAGKLNRFIGRLEKANKHFTEDMKCLHEVSEFYAAFIHAGLTTW